MGTTGWGDFNWANLEEAVFRLARREGAELRGAKLDGADFRGINLGNDQRIEPRFADVHWGATNLSIVDWSQMTKLGDEWVAEQSKWVAAQEGPEGQKKMRIHF